MIADSGLACVVICVYVSVRRFHCVHVSKHLTALPPDDISFEIAAVATTALSSAVTKFRRHTISGMLCASFMSPTAEPSRFFTKCHLHQTVVVRETRLLRKRVARRTPRPCGFAATVDESWNHRALSLYGSVRCAGSIATAGEPVFVNSWTGPTASCPPAKRAKYIAAAPNGAGTAAARSSLAGLPLFDRTRPITCAACWGEKYIYSHRAYDVAGPHNMSEVERPAHCHVGKANLGPRQTRGVAYRCCCARTWKKCSSTLPRAAKPSSHRHVAWRQMNNRVQSKSPAGTLRRD